MKILKTNQNEVDKKVIDEAVKVLADGGVILYPTDTVYGLGANIFNRKAVKKVYNIKKRSYLKPVSLLVSSKDAIPLVSKASLNQLNFIDKYLPGPYTFILKKSKIVPRHLTSGSVNVGVRVPKSEIACSLAKIFPITTTSANLSNKDTLDTPEEILKQLGCEVDLIIDVGPLKSGNPSTIIDLTGEEPVFVKR
ncbi:MAG: L-threonylcarbamoyladenylate synthase [Methanobrevibacter smithii]|jgi:L-threonylcarbamoyladenylate synthase|uniref:L-threonylcarbamoyladenylate synthase n=1 Tax=Methanobrevibacter TaxID=2172 RepID=UPI0003626CBA|nr:MULTISPECIES: L-threonylcarbamoyladenylate synthase [Methanobrevibacter]URN50092.1 threonylcarbamoyl-AMP synthase [Methanobrevibacter sp. TLL-48-HuF1]